MKEMIRIFILFTRISHEKSVKVKQNERIPKF